MMTNTEYIARTVNFYSQNNAKIGSVNFDKDINRFIIRSIRNENMTTPEDGIHCGDVYILRDIDGCWKIGQCELVGDVWKFFGTSITADNCMDVPIIYVPNKRIMRYSNFFTDADMSFESLSYDFVSQLIA